MKLSLSKFPKGGGSLKPMKVYSYGPIVGYLSHSQKMRNRRLGRFQIVRECHLIERWRLGPCFRDVNQKASLVNSISWGEEMTTYSRWFSVLIPKPGFLRYSVARWECAMPSDVITELGQNMWVICSVDTWMKRLRFPIIPSCRLVSF